MATSPSSSSRAQQPLRLHQRCELTTYGRGEILFVGQTSFSHGVWVGIALDEAVGKHDGVVQGKRYFTAHRGHGIFVRSSQVYALLSDEGERDASEEEDVASEPRPTPPPPPPPVTAPRQTTSRASMVSSATGRISAAASRTISPAKSAADARGRMSVTPGSAAAAFSGAAGRQQPVKRPSVATASASARTSPFKAPTARPAAMARTSTAPTSAVVRPRVSTVSPVKAPAPAVGTRTSLTAARPTAASAAAQRTALTQARSAVQAGRAPDTATARAGLRSVAKTRHSMAPPASSSSDTSSNTPRTPARTVVRAAPHTTVPRRTVPTSSTPASSTTRSAAATPLSTRGPRTIGETSSSVRSSRPPTLDGTENDEALDEDDEDLMAMRIADAEEALDEGALNGDAHPASPSLRKAPRASVQPDHMSLSSGPSMTSIARKTGEYAALQRELDEARVKLRLSEKKRDEEREKVREAEHLQQESEQFLVVKPKMVAKQQELQNELKELHQIEREWTTQKEEYERQIAELNDQVEILSLDKEMAEERAEGTADEVQVLKDRVEELELDMEVLREENARFETGPVEEKDRLSVGYMQLEKQNERLKEALIRLRDLTAESDAGQKQRIGELERELRALDELQASYESACARLQQSDALLEDLKIQLDDALGAEEMLEQLTERNLALGERVDEMRMTIEDLEALKDLNDELEETHIETEKQLQEELDLKEMQMRELRVRSDTFEANIVEYENTFGQFRELVLTLQSEVEALRDDEKARDATRAAVGAEDQAMLNLNFKLQSSTLKSQAKTIELEIGKMQATQAERQLSMVSSYLPKRYFEQDKDAVDSLLFFQRIAVKTEIIKGIMESNTDVAGSLVGVVEERLIVICRMRHSLAHFMASARQIVAIVQLASIPTFLKSGRMFKELTSVERRIDQFIDLLRREELKEEECAQEYRRFIKMLEDFEFALLDGSSELIESDLAAKELGSATLFDLDLDTIAAALGFAKQSIAGLYNDFNQQTAAATAATETTAGEGGDVSTTAKSAAADIEMRMSDLDIDVVLFTPLQELINAVRSTKVPARKLLRRLAALYGNEEAVKMEAIVKLPGMGRLTSQLVAFASTLATSFGTYTSNVRTNKTPFELKEVLAIVDEASREAMGSSTQESGAAGPMWASTLGETSQLSQTVTDLLQAATEQDNVQKVVGTSPWLGRVDEMRQEQENNAESQRTIAKQTEDLRDLYKQIKVRDEVIEENRIKIERINKQLQRSRLDNETVTTLRDELVDTTKRMKAYEESNSALQGELEQLQRQYERALDDGVRTKDGGDGNSARAAAATADGGQGTDAAALGDAVGVTASALYGAAVGSGLLPSSSYEVSYLVDQLEALRGAVKYLRLENGLLKGKELLAQTELLPPLAQRLSREDSGVSLPSLLSDDSNKAESDADPQRGLPRSKKETRMLGRGRPGSAVASSAVQGTVDARQTAESRRLVQDWIRMASSPRVITLRRTTKDVNGTDTAKSTGSSQRRPWVPMAQLPQHQFREQMRERARLRARIEQLGDSLKKGTVSGGIVASPATAALRV